MSSTKKTKPPVKYPTEARERAKELHEQGNEYKEIKVILQKEFKIKPSDGWIRGCIKEGEEKVIEQELDPLTDAEKPSLEKILSDYIRQNKAKRIAQTFELSRGQPNDLQMIMENENVKVNFIKVVIMRMWGQDVMESIYGKGAVSPQLQSLAKKESPITEEFDKLIRQDLEMTKIDMMKKQMEKLKSDDSQKPADGMAQLSQLMMLDKMTRGNEKDSGKDMLNILEALKVIESKGSDSGTAVLLETIKMTRDQQNKLEELRIKERELQYNREMQMRQSLDSERSDALRREFERLRTEQERAVSTPEDFGARMLFWKETIKELGGDKKSTGDFMKDVELRKIDLQDKVLDKGVAIIDSRLSAIEKRMDRAIDTYLNMIEKQQERQYQVQGVGTPHPRTPSGTQTPLAPPPRTSEEREEAYEQLTSDVEKLQTLREARRKLDKTHGL